MTFESLDRAFSYFSTEYPNRLFVVLPIRTPYRVIGYHLQLHDRGSVMTQAFPFIPPREVRLSQRHDQKWDINVDEGR